MLRNQLQKKKVNKMIKFKNFNLILDCKNQDTNKIFKNKHKNNYNKFNILKIR